MIHISLLKPNDPIIELESELGNATWGRLGNHILNRTLDVAFFADLGIGQVSPFSRQRFFVDLQPTEVLL